MEGKKPKEVRTVKADGSLHVEAPVPPNSLASSDQWIKGKIVGRMGLHVDDFIMRGKKQVNQHTIAAIRKIWGTSEPEHVGPEDQKGKLKFLGIMITRAEVTRGDIPKGSWLLSQEEYILEVLSRYSRSLHYKSRKTPGQPETFKGGRPKKEDKEQTMKQEKEKTDEDEEWEEASVAAIMGALLWISLRTRPDIAWAVTRVTRAAQYGKTPDDVEIEARVQIKHIMQYLAATWDMCLVYRILPASAKKILFITSDASLAPGGGKSHEGVTIFMGRDPESRNLIHWKSGKQALTSLSSCESDLVGA
eukprot:1890129-Amphidinium_carterae.1